MYSRIKNLPFILLAVLFLPDFALAETSCTVEPFAAKISQGESANFSVFLTLDDPSAPYELSLGSLPNNVDGGFSGGNATDSGVNTKKAPLSVTAKANAQTGSFMITAIAKSALAGATFQTSCQFNLEIVKKSAAVNSITQNSASVTIQNQVPLTQSVGSGILPGIISASSTIILHTNTGVSSFAASSSQSQPAQTAKLAKPVAATGQVPANFGGKFTVNMQYGSYGPQVQTLQNILQKLGFFPAEEETTYYFRSITEGAVKSFQASKGIEPIGIVGPITRRALDVLTR